MISNEEEDGDDVMDNVTMTVNADADSESCTSDTDSLKEKVLNDANIDASTVGDEADVETRQSDTSCDLSFSTSEGEDNDGGGIRDFVVNTIEQILDGCDGNTNLSMVSQGNSPFKDLAFSRNGGAATSQGEVAQWCMLYLQSKYSPYQQVDGDVFVCVFL